MYIFGIGIQSVPKSMTEKSVCLQLRYLVNKVTNNYQYNNAEVNFCIKNMAGAQRWYLGDGEFIYQLSIWNLNGIILSISSLSQYFSILIKKWWSQMSIETTLFPFYTFDKISSMSSVAFSTHIMCDLSLQLFQYLKSQFLKWIHFILNLKSFLENSCLMSESRNKIRQKME
jgi:hypothetical protein